MVVYPITVNNFASPFKLHVGGLGFRFYDGSSVKAYLKLNFG